MKSIAKTSQFENEITAAWSRVTQASPLSRIRSKRQYVVVVKAMEYLADVVNDRPRHPLVGLLEVLEVLVEDYDRVHHALPPVSSVERLKSLMAEHELHQSDLAELGSQGVMSEILAGKRRLNKRHAGLLAKRFSLPEELFA